MKGDVIRMAKKKNVAEETVQSTQTAEQKEPTFTKEQLVSSERYENEKDLVTALLEDDKSYTIAETDKLISNHKKRKVE